MERNEVSLHEVRVYVVFRGKPGWLTARSVAEKAKIAERTARAHCRKLVALGILDKTEVFPAHRFRFAEKASKRNTGYVQRLEAACEVFGIEAT